MTKRKTAEPEETYRLTPQGFLSCRLMELGHDSREGKRLWDDLCAFGIRQLFDDKVQADAAAILLKHSGHVVGLDEVPTRPKKS